MLVGRSDLIQLEGGERNRGRPKKTWVEAMRNNMIALKLKSK